MFSEIIKYLMTPCPPHLKSMGYLKELIALDARYGRCKNAWQPHLEMTKSVIHEAMDTVPIKNTAVVLGSGILADIPIKALSEQFERVQLVDICFLNKTRKSIAPYGHVECVGCDITGVAAPLYRWIKEGHRDMVLPVPNMPTEIDIMDADLVISANILSQLQLTPITYLKNKRPTVDDVTLQQFGQNIIQAHLALLNTCRGTVCLISEVERQFCDADTVLETEDPLWGHVLNMKGKSWIWDMAPKAETSLTYDIRQRVSGHYWHHDTES